MVTEKIVYVTTDGKEFSDKTEAEEYDTSYKIAEKIQKMMVSQDLDFSEMVPADISLWIAKHVIIISQLAHEVYTKETEQVDERCATQEVHFQGRNSIRS